MKLKALATLPTAFLAGLAGRVGLRLFENWTNQHSIRSTSLLILVLYLVLFVAPFLLFVVGIDPQRWNENHRFSEQGRTDERRTWMRWAAYLVGTILVGYAL
jgi:hypothetical protein